MTGLAARRKLDYGLKFSLTFFLNSYFCLSETLLGKASVEHYRLNYLHGSDLLIQKRVHYKPNSQPERELVS